MKTLIRKNDIGNIINYSEYSNDKIISSYEARDNILYKKRIDSSGVVHSSVVCFSQPICLSLSEYMKITTVKASPLSRGKERIIVISRLDAENGLLTNYNIGSGLISHCIDLLSP